ncbi:uncharacterized protein N7479_001926 [Penicillium vulpinum]|uniref:uncharacterized protein n=1 Tax=Penicillium vulpinum TaxID=29845 RepID=UPI002547CF9D|nr:uncharacterized protein N7479_001926 [Penicillium vulpinum]KAJ5972008.1 hypothetical protein N7479_001926 [Penicillium vulpinum]
MIRNAPQPHSQPNQPNQNPSHVGRTQRAPNLPIHQTFVFEHPKAPEAYFNRLHSAQGTATKLRLRCIDSQPRHTRAYTGAEFQRQSGCVGLDALPEAREFDAMPSPF